MQKKHNNRDSQLSNNDLTRLFVALPLQPAEKTYLNTIIHFLTIEDCLQGQNIQWVSKEKLHITVQFLGNITLSKGKKLFTYLQQYSKITQPFLLETKKLITLPEKSNPKILALSIKKTKLLMNLAALTHRLATELNVKISDRTYLPHLTLGYFKNSSDHSKLLKLPIQKIILHPKKIVLFESVTTSGTSEYIPIKQINFGSALNAE